MTASKKKSTAKGGGAESGADTKKGRRKGPHFVPVEDAPGPGLPPRTRELLALLLIGACLFSLVALATFASAPVGIDEIPRGGMRNLGGSIGYAIAYGSTYLLGLAGWIPFFAGIVFGIAMFAGHRIDRVEWKIVGVVVFSAMMSIALAGADGLAEPTRLAPEGPGGRFGANTSPRLTSEFGGAGRILLLVFGGLCSLLLATQWLISELFWKLAGGMEQVGHSVAEKAVGLGQKAHAAATRAPRPAYASGSEESQKSARTAKSAESDSAERGPGVFAKLSTAARQIGGSITAVLPGGRRAGASDESVDGQGADDPAIEGVGEVRPIPKAEKTPATPKATRSKKASAETAEPAAAKEPEPIPEPEPEPQPEPKAPEPAAPEPRAVVQPPPPPAPVARKKPVVKRKPAPKKPAPRPASRKKRSDQAELPFAGGWEFPPSSLFREPEEAEDDSMQETLDANKEAIERRLASFKVEAQVVHASVGPAVTLYELELGEGIKLSKIHGYEADLAAALKAVSVRVVAPIPGKHTVGIEVPNKERQMVVFRELLDRFQMSEERAIPLYLGKDVAGDPIVEDLAKMPHLLIAGTTGSGKSVCINSILLSILTTRTPEQVRLVLIDPKMVELQVYKKVPHLACDVVTNMKKAPQVLQWAVDEMERRYELLSKVGTNHIRNYNRLGRDEIEERLGTTITDELAHLPYIVLVIDELADLMNSAQREVEESIQRLAQKSRAVGLHVILATQRPSTDVITGVIKANLPAQIAFKVNRKIDSRVILDSNGAEKLLGHGDMLYLTPSTQELKRAQGAFVSEDETQGVTSWLEEHGPPPDFIPELVQSDTGNGRGNKDRDELYDKAVEVVLGQQRGSATLIQRALAVGYNRATRLLEMMEEDGLVGPFVGSKSREVMLTVDEWREREESIADELAAVADADEDDAEYEDGEYDDTEYEDAEYDDAESEDPSEDGSDDEEYEYVEEEASAEDAEGDGEESDETEWVEEDGFEEADDEDDSGDSEALQDKDGPR